MKMSVVILTTAASSVVGLSLPTMSYARDFSSCWSVPLHPLSSASTGLLPKTFTMNGVRVRTSSAGTRVPDLNHAIQQSADGNVTEFSTRNSSAERLATDKAYGRRSEVRLLTALAAGVVYHGAYTFTMRGWRGNQLVMGQAHAPKGLDGSPVWALRRIKNGDAAIYARALGERGAGSAIWSAPVNWSVPHDLVFEVRYGRTRGYLKVWLDGKPIVQEYRWRNALVDTGPSGIYWKQGIYAALGQTSDQMWVRYANVIFHNTDWDPRQRIAAPKSC
jgi:hypothetical protein